MNENNLYDAVTSLGLCVAVDSSRCAMLTWDEIAVNSMSCFGSADIYTQAPMSRFDSRFKVTLSRRRCDCLLHHDKSTNLTASVINTLSHSFSEQNAPVFTDISVDNGIRHGACSCRELNGQIKGTCAQDL